MEAARIAHFSALTVLYPAMATASMNKGANKTFRLAWLLLIVLISRDFDLHQLILISQIDRFTIGSSRQIAPAFACHNRRTPAQNEQAQHNNSDTFQCDDPYLDKLTVRGHSRRG